MSAIIKKAEHSNCVRITKVTWNKWFILFFFFCLCDNLCQMICVHIRLSPPQISLKSQQNKKDTRQTFGTI